MPTVTSTNGKLVSFTCAQCRELAIVDREIREWPYVFYCSDACAKAADVARRLTGPRDIEWGWMDRP